MCPGQCLLPQSRDSGKALAEGRTQLIFGGQRPFHSAWERAIVMGQKFCQNARSFVILIRADKPHLI